MSCLLEINDLCVNYGNLSVLHRVSLKVNANEIVVLFGHNGAGKTTLLKTILGINSPILGEIKFYGRPISTVSAKPATNQRIALVPQGKGIFPSLTVEENLKLGLFAANVRAESEEGRRRLERVFHYLPVLRDRLKEKAGRLSGGQQQMVSIGRALAAAPSLLLMDEPSIGLSPKVVQDVMLLLRRLQEEDQLAVLLVEQNVRQALKVAQRVYVMKAGKIILETVPEKLTDLNRLWDLF